MSVANLRFLNETSGLLLETCNPDQINLPLKSIFPLPVIIVLRLIFISLLLIGSS